MAGGLVCYSAPRREQLYRCTGLAPICRFDYRGHGSVRRIHYQQLEFPFELTVLEEVFWERRQVKRGKLPEERLTSPKFGVGASSSLLENSLNSSLTYEVVDLARSQAASFELRRHVMVALRPLGTALLRLPHLVVGYAVTAAIKSFARKQNELAVWFRGASAALQDSKRSECLDPEDELRRKLDLMESHLLSLRGETLKLLQRRVSAGRGDSEVAGAMRHLVAAATELYEDVRSFKGALQAHDADVCALKAGAAHPTEMSSDDVDAALGQLFTEK